MEDVSNGDKWRTEIFSERTSLASREDTDDNDDDDDKQR